MSGGEETTTSVDHPIGELAHAETGGVAEMLFLFLVGVWVIRVTVEPRLEVVGRLLGELATLARGAVDEGRGGHGRG